MADQLPWASSKPSSSDIEDLERCLIEDDFPTFATRFLWIQTKTRGLQPFALWPHQLDRAVRRRLLRYQNPLMWELVLKFRQGGFSKNELAEDFFFALRNPDSNVLIIAHEQKLPQEFLDAIRVFIECLPAPLRPTVTKDSASELYFGDLRTSIRIGTGRMLQEGAGIKLGRTVQRLHISEGSDPAFRSGPLIELFQTVPAACEVVCETTAKGAVGWFPDAWEGAKRGENQWYPFFYEWWWMPVEEYGLPVPDDFEPDEEEAALMAAHPVLPEQIMWRRYKIRQMGGDKRKFLEQYPENDVDCFMLSGSPLFDQESLRRLLDGAGFCRVAGPGGALRRWPELRCALERVGPAAH